MCLKFQIKIRELFVCVLLVCCAALLASTYTYILITIIGHLLYLKPQKKQSALIRYLWPKLIVVFTYPILPLMIVYYWYLFWATGGRTVSFIVDILLFVVSWYDLYYIYLWCLHCGPNCFLFFCFFVVFCCFLAFPIPIVPQPSICIPRIPSISLFLHLYIFFFVFLFFLYLFPSLHSSCFLHHSSFRCGLLHLRQ